MPGRRTVSCVALGAAAAVCLAAGPAEADGWHRWYGGGPRVGVFVGPPAVVVRPPIYAPPPVVFAPPVYVAPPPVYYAPALASACYAGPVTCPLYGPQALGTPCQCQAGYSVFPGRAG